MPWTANELQDRRRLLDWKVDGIITDRPDRPRTLLQESPDSPSSSNLFS